VATGHVSAHSRPGGASKGRVFNIFRALLLNNLTPSEIAIEHLKELDLTDAVFSLSR
jgi:hypothetical protein